MTHRALLVAVLLAASPALFAQPGQPAQRPAPQATGHADEHAMFRQADTNGDGRLSEEEKTAFRASRPHPQRDPRGIPVAKLDTNGDGFISREEHEAFRQQHQEHKERREQRQEKRQEHQDKRQERRDQRG